MEFCVVEKGENNLMENKKFVMYEQQFLINQLNR